MPSTIVIELEGSEDVAFGKLGLDLGWDELSGE
jgi:hypothetical protein